MAGEREAVLAALESLAIAALPGADVKRNRSEATRLGPAGAVSLYDGDPGEPEIDLSPPIYNYAHRIPVVFAAASPAALDLLHRALGAAVEADRTLGGRCQYLETVAPDVEPLDVAGAEASAQSEGAIVAHYSTKSPL